MFGNLVKKVRAFFNRPTRKKPTQAINERSTFSVKAVQPKQPSSATRHVDRVTVRSQPQNSTQKLLPGMPKNTRSQVYQSRLFDRRKRPDAEMLGENKNEKRCN